MVQIKFSIVTVFFLVAAAIAPAIALPAVPRIPKGSSLRQQEEYYKEHHDKSKSNGKKKK